MAKKFIPTKDNCTVPIIPDRETGKAYGIITGDNGKMFINRQLYYTWIAKSVCFIDTDGIIYAPVWATDSISWKVLNRMYTEIKNR